MKSTVIHTSVNIFEVSKRDKSQYCVDKVKDKRRNKNNNLEFLIGWCGFPDPKPDTWEPLGWWKQHHQEFPDLVRMARQYLTIPDTSVSPERFFSCVGLVQTDLCGSLLDTTMIDLMWSKQARDVIFQEMNKEDTHTPHTHTQYLLTH